jgi:hypothetical protein
MEIFCASLILASAINFCGQLKRPIRMGRSPIVSTVRMLRNKKPSAVSRGLKSFVCVGDPEKKYKISKGIVRRTTRGFSSSAAAIFAALLFSTS